VHGLLGEQQQDRGTDVTATGAATARASATAVEAGPAGAEARAEAASAGVVLPTAVAVLGPVAVLRPVAGVVCRAGAEPGLRDEADAGSEAGAPAPRTAAARVEA